MQKTHTTAWKMQTAVNFLEWSGDQIIKTGLKKDQFDLCNFDNCTSQLLPTVASIITLNLWDYICHPCDKGILIVSIGFWPWMSDIKKMIFVCDFRDLLFSNDVTYFIIIFWIKFLPPPRSHFLNCVHADVYRHTSTPFPHKKVRFNIT